MVYIKYWCSPYQYGIFCTTRDPPTVLSFLCERAIVSRSLSRFTWACDGIQIKLLRARSRRDPRSGMVHGFAEQCSAVLLRPSLGTAEVGRCSHRAGFFGNTALLLRLKTCSLDVLSRVVGLNDMTSQTLAISLAATTTPSISTEVIASQVQYNR